MMYFANPSGATTRDLMLKQVIGFIDTPLQGNKRPDGVIWCADNGCFNDEKFNADKWFRWLQKNRRDAATCVFATAPDVYADAAATLERSRPWLAKIRALGYPAAYVAQDGQEHFEPPWNEFDALFVGGRKTERRQDEWKFSRHAQALVAEAKRRGKHVHYGRINSGLGWRHAEAAGAHSCDGTYIVFGPRTNLPKLLGWIAQPSLFEEAS